MDKIAQIKKRLNLGSKILVLGASGSGKTTMARELSSDYPRKLHIDILGDPDYEGMPSVSNVHDLFRAMKFYKSKSQFDLVFRMDTGDKKENIATMDQIHQLCWAFKNIHIFIDECDSYCTTQYLSQWYMWNLRRGRHHDVSMTNLTQTPSDLNKHIIKQSHEKLYGYFSEKNDIAYVSSLGMWTMDDVLNVKQYEFIHEHNREWSIVKLAL